MKKSSYSNVLIYCIFDAKIFNYFASIGSIYCRNFNFLFDSLIPSNLTYLITEEGTLFALRLIVTDRNPIITIIIIIIIIKKGQQCKAERE